MIKSWWKRLSNHECRKLCSTKNVEAFIVGETNSYEIRKKLEGKYMTKSVEDCKEGMSVTHLNEFGIIEFLLIEDFNVTDNEDKALLL